MIPSIAASLLLMVGTSVIPKEHTFTGEIMDTDCSPIGIHAVVGPLKTKRQCTIDCVRFGAQYVLYDPDIQMAYGLDDQRRPERFAGEAVIVTGTLDKISHVIHVLDVRPMD